MATAKEIIEKLGKAREVAADLGVPLSTVTSWAQFNYIPDWRKPALLQLAGKKRVSLTADEFPTPAERVSRAKAA